MGNNSSFDRHIAAQESYVRREMAKIPASSNYVGYNRYDSKGNQRTYSTTQIAGKLRQEFCGTNTYKNRDSYVLSSDWERMRNSRR